jgi:uncharacterized tellurite resistance protein B-like protein
MSDPPREPVHPARTLPEPERVDYLIAVASLVIADSHVDEAELAIMRRLCRALDVTPASEERVIEAAKSPDRAKVESVLHDVSRDVPLRVSLLADAIVVAFADGRLARAETAEIAALARKLSVSPAQAVLIARSVEEAVAEERTSKEPEAGVDSRGRPLSVLLAEGLTEDERARPQPAMIRWLYRAVRGRKAG